MNVKFKKNTWRYFIRFENITNPKQKTFIVNSIFNSGLAEFDNNIAFIELNVLEEFFGYDPNERNLEVYLKNSILLKNWIINNFFIYINSNVNI